MSYSYAEAIATLKAQGYKVDANGEWGPVSQESWWFYIRSTAYASGLPITDSAAGYGFAYSGAVDPNFSAGVASGTGYVATPRSYATGTYQWTFTATEAGGHASAFNWHYGDGATGTGNPSTHTFAAHGNYTPYLNVTVGSYPAGPFYGSVITV